MWHFIVNYLTNEPHDTNTIKKLHIKFEVKK